MMRASLYGALCSLVTSHNCRSGAPQCTAVLITSHEHARSQSARGSNLCTSDGRVLHCLLDHGHHNRNCAENEAACCADGSFPDNFVANTNMPDCQALTTEHSEQPAGTGLESMHQSKHREHIRKGFLLLKIAAAAEDTLSKLRSDKARSVIKAVLRELSGAESVALQSFFHLHGSDRRLAAASDFKVGFEAHGHQWQPIADAALLAALQTGLDELSVELKVDSAIVEWEDVESKDHLQLQVVVIAIVSAILSVTIVGGVAWLVKRRARSVATQAGTVVENVSDKDNDNTDVESASTGTGSLSDGMCSTDSEKDPCTAGPMEDVHVMAI